jgi:two-component system nitrate/nitrite response regulator NarL
MSPLPALNVVVVNSRLLFREALTTFLQAQPDFKVSAHVPAVEHALRICSITPVQCAVVEFESRQIESFCASLNILNTHTRVLLMGDLNRVEELEKFRPLAAGILSDSCNGGALIEAIRRVSSGQTWEDLPHLDGSANLPLGPHSTKLTSRQQMVLHLVCQGHSNKECAHLVGVSDSSIKCTIQQLFAKTSTGSRSQLVRHTMQDLQQDDRSYSSASA